ncbi:2-oxoacid dehydrogenases acyltransferase-domain-containing protein [Phyllosticta citriasiana]|uniref:2-oxoacid dehydrogenases acyltransferase-domain-containing protein n=1 Tax=Phyllosticta citriasiana TaxID=595635 RepID=UPI0030FD7308
MRHFFTGLRPASRPPLLARPLRSSAPLRHCPARCFHASARRTVVKPYLLADIGEGITECQVIQWFVRPGARVEQFDKICEVQSDKATVEVTAQTNFAEPGDHVPTTQQITSRFDGVIKKLHYEADEVAKVGKPLVDIDIQGEISAADAAIVESPEPEASAQPGRASPTSSGQPSEASAPDASTGEAPIRPYQSSEKAARGKYANLATPAVRHMLKQLNIEITDVQGTGKDGRVLKEDVQRYAASKDNPPEASTTAMTPSPLPEDRTVPLTPIQRQMFKTMTKSLSIPHFLYTDSIDFTPLNDLRHRLNTTSTALAPAPCPKLSALPFILKAVSHALTHFPSLNAHVDDSSPSSPKLIHKASHDIGIAVDSPSGLLVPVVRAVQAHTIHSLAAEIARLSALARDGKLASADLAGPSFTVSNIGSIGGGAVAPVIVPPQVGILGVGRARAVPAFAPDGSVVRRDEAVLSWAADHRVVDGAMVARCAEVVRACLEDPAAWLVVMK